MRTMNGIGGRVGHVEGGLSGERLSARRTDVVTVVLVDGSWLESEEKRRGELYT